MKKSIILTLLLALIAMFLSCATLRVSKDQRPSEKEAKELQAILDTISYGKKFEMDVFDCSNMSAYVFDFLTKKDYKCSIINGYDSRFSIFKRGNWHGWVEARKNGKIFYVETTAKKVVKSEFYDYFHLKFRFDSLEQLRKLTKIFGREKEWEY